MNAFAPGAIDQGRPSLVKLDLYTSAYRVSGQTATRFSRVADVLNQATGTHLLVEQATISEFADPTATLGAPQVHVAIVEILVCIADLQAEARPEMRIPKRQVKAQVAVPPFRLTGTVHVPQGSRPVDGLLNIADRFVAMTEVTIGCATYPELARTAPALAVQRDRAHVLLVADDERPDQLLADVLDEQTAHGWLGGREPAPGG